MSPDPAIDIDRLLPHGGGMRLIASVIRHDAHRITAFARDHRRPDHPLRAADGLSCLACIEMAAQATALHAALLAGGGRASAAQLRVLAAIRDAVFACEFLDEVPAPLLIQAELRQASAQAASYLVQASGGGRQLMRAELLLAAAPPP